MRITLLLLAVTLLLLLSCGKEKVAEDFRVGEYRTLYHIEDVKLTESGKQHARTAWDSIKPLLQRDSTVHGSEFSGVKIKGTKGPFIWLTFDYDSGYAPPHRLTFNMIPAIGAIPTTYMYFGNHMIICRDKFSSGIYSDTVGIVLERGVQNLMRGEGIRIDTDRGPTDKLSTDQVESLNRTMTAYMALSLLHNKYNYSPAPKTAL